MRTWLWRHPLILFNVKAALVLVLAWALTIILPLIVTTVVTGSIWWELPPASLPLFA